MGDEIAEAGRVQLHWALKAIREFTFYFKAKKQLQDFDNSGYVEAKHKGCGNGFQESN